MTTSRIYDTINIEKQKKEGIKMKLFLLGMVTTILLINSFMAITMIIKDWENREGWKIHRIIFIFFLGIFGAVVELLDI